MLPTPRARRAVCVFSADDTVPRDESAAGDEGDAAIADVGDGDGVCGASLSALRGALPPTVNGEGVAGTLDVLEARLSLHVAFRALYLRPVLRSGRPCPSRLFEVWAMETLRLFSVLQGLVESTRLLDLGDDAGAQVSALSGAVRRNVLRDLHVLGGRYGAGAP